MALGGGGGVIGGSSWFDLGTKGIWQNSFTALPLLMASQAPNNIVCPLPLPLPLRSSPSPNTPTQNEYEQHGTYRGLCSPGFYSQPLESPAQQHYLKVGGRGLEGAQGGVGGSGLGLWGSGVGWVGGQRVGRWQG